MPLAAAYPLLIKAIESAFENKTTAINALKGYDKVAVDAINKKFYIELALSIHKYTMSADVSTMVVGGMVGVAAPIVPMVSVAAPVYGPVTGVGWGNLL